MRIVRAARGGTPRAVAGTLVVLALVAASPVPGPAAHAGEAGARGAEDASAQGSGGKPAPDGDDATTKPGDEAAASETAAEGETPDLPETLVPNPPRPYGDVARLGERLVFLVKWQGVPGGTVTLRVWPKERKIHGRPVYMFELQAESNDFLSVFYSVNTTIRSVADAADGRSYLFQRSMRQGTVDIDDRLEFLYDHRLDDGTPQPVSRFSHRKKGRMRKRDPRPIPGFLADPLAIAYYMRHLEIDVEKKAPSALMGLHKGAAMVTLVPLRREMLKLPGLGSFDTVVIQPRAPAMENDEGIFETKGMATVWLERSTRIPLQAKVETPIGDAIGILVEHEKTPLESVRVAAPAAGETAPDPDAAPAATGNPFATEAFQKALQAERDAKAGGADEADGEEDGSPRAKDAAPSSGSAGPGEP